MFNIGVISDLSWDNFILIHNKLKKINFETCRIHTIYGKSLEIINNCCSKNLLTLLRHYSEDLSNTIYNMLKICDLWIIFTNHIEYLNPSHLIIEKCIEYNINYITISEYNKNIDYYSFTHENLSFKKIIGNLENLKLNNKENIENDKEQIKKFNYEIYNNNFNKKSSLSLTITPHIKSKIKNSYDNYNSNKKEHSIKLLYDKDELKRDKTSKKTIKLVNQLDFENKRYNYYKNSNNNDNK
jgi:hypothetical protein